MRKLDLKTSPEVRKLVFAIHLAVHGHAEVVRQLLDGRADVNKARTADGSTSLYAVAQAGHVAVMRLLLDGREV